MVADLTEAERLFHAYIVDRRNELAQKLVFVLTET